MAQASAYHHTNRSQEGTTMATPNRRTKNAVSAAKLDRRIFCKGATVAMGAAMLAPTMGRAVLAADAPVAETTSGKVNGVSTDGVHAFKGVPGMTPEEFQKARRRADATVSCHRRGRSRGRAFAAGSTGSAAPHSRRPIAVSGPSLAPFRAGLTGARRPRNA